MGLTVLEAEGSSSFPPSNGDAMTISTIEKSCDWIDISWEYNLMLTIRHCQSAVAVVAAAATAAAAV